MGASLRVPTVDWPRLICEMRGKGLQAQVIASKVGMAPSTLGNLQNGLTAEPPYSIGVALLALHAKVMQL
jgi:hypothetical protein